MKQNLSRVGALAFIAFFITIVIIADRGEGDRWWAFVHEVPFGDKLGHLVLIGTLGLLCNLAIRPRRVLFLPRFVTRTTVVLFVLLSFEELAQALLPNRTCDFFDWVADIAGLTIGQFFAARVRARFFQ